MNTLIFIGFSVFISEKNAINYSNLKFKITSLEYCIMAAIHEDAAMAHTLGVLCNEDAPRGSHVPGGGSCRDLGTHTCCTFIYLSFIIIY